MVKFPILPSLYAGTKHIDGFCREISGSACFRFHVKILLWGATSKHHSTHRHSHSVACPSLCSNKASLPPTQHSSRIHRATSHPESSEHIPYSNKSRLTLLPGFRIALLPFLDVQQWKCQCAPHPRIPPTTPIHSRRVDLSARTPPRAKTAAASIYPV